jgi:hypothetical protein
MARRIYFGWPVVINDLDLTEIDSLTVTDNITVGGKGIIGSAVSDSVGFYGVGPVSSAPRSSRLACLLCLRESPGRRVLRSPIRAVTQGRSL